MLFSVDFSIKTDGIFRTIYTAFIHADSVNDCKKLSEEIKTELAENETDHVHIFIGE